LAEKRRDLRDEIGKRFSRFGDQLAVCPWMDKAVPESDIWQLLFVALARGIRDLAPVSRGD
jgi:hypothetical protein